jgi:hypothetical protein
MSREEQEEADYFFEQHPEAERPRAQKQYSKPIGPVQQPHYGVNANQYASAAGPAQVNPNQYASPAGPARPSTMDRIVGAARNMGAQVQKFDQGSTGQAIRKHAERLNQQDGFGGSGSRGQPRENPASRYARFTNDNPEPVNQGSVMHPGHRIIVVEGSVIASARAPGTEPRESRRRGRGGLGGANPGFGEDRGL